MQKLLHKKHRLHQSRLRTNRLAPRKCYVAENHHIEDDIKNAKADLRRYQW
jgi:hypothetical protein